MKREVTLPITSPGRFPPLGPVVPVRSLDTVVNLFHAGRYGALPRAIMRRTLNDLIPGENNPTPKARLNLLDIIIHGAMLHDVHLCLSLRTAPAGSDAQTENLPESICHGRDNTER